MREIPLEKNGVSKMHGNLNLDDKTPPRKVRRSHFIEPNKFGTHPHGKGGKNARRHERREVNQKLKNFEDLD